MIIKFDLSKRRVVLFYDNKKEKKEFGNDIAETNYEAILTFALHKVRTSDRDVTFVLEDDMIGVDYIENPTLSRGRDMMDNLNADLNNLYKNLGDLRINKQVLSSNRTKTIYKITVMKKSFANLITRVVEKLGYNVKSFISATAFDTDLITLNTKQLGKGPYVLVNVKRDSTGIAFLYNTDILFSARLDYGTNILFEERIARKSEMNPYYTSLGIVTSSTYIAKKGLSNEEVEAIAQTASYKDEPALPRSYFNESEAQPSEIIQANFQVILMNVLQLQTEMAQRFSGFDFSRLVFVFADVFANDISNGFTNLNEANSYSFIPYSDVSVDKIVLRNAFKFRELRINFWGKIK